MAKKSRRRTHRNGGRSATAKAAATSAAATAVAVLTLSADAFVPLTTRQNQQQPPAFAGQPASAFIASSTDISITEYACRQHRSRVVAYMSDGIGGGLGDRNGGGGRDGGDGRGSGNGKMGGFEDESENLRSAREKISEDSLPVSFGFERENGTKENDDDGVDGEENKAGKDTSAKGGELARKEMDPAAAALNLKDNPYLEVVSRLSPSDLISKFTTTAHPRVQDAVRSTILGLIGNLPKMAFDTTTITTGERLASLMFQLQMTGYMFKNAEYRLSLAQSLGMDHMPTSEGMAKSGYLLEGTLSPHDDDDDVSPIKLDGKVKGKIRVKYGGGASAPSSSAAAGADEEGKEEVEANEDDATKEDTPASGGTTAGATEIEVDAAAYMSELRDEVSRLKEELTETRKSKDATIKKDLLLYIRTMPREELASLTGTISPDVLGAMKGLVNVVMAGVGEGRIEPDTVTEQSGEAMAQLCMWQLVVGYNLRELEVREEMRAALGGSPPEDGRDENGRIWYGSG